jgi:hypothetical protein
MKFSRLSEIDLAKAMSVAPGRPLEDAMRNYNAGGGAWSYGPTRASTPDLVAARPPLVEVTSVPWVQLASQITRVCTRGRDQVASNVQVSQVLFDKARQLGWTAVQEAMGSLSVGFGESVRFWSDVVIADADGPFIPFFDHRRNGGLTSPAIRHIAFSMQHIGIRERNLDLADARLAIVRFPVVGETRTMTVHFHYGSTRLLPYEELDARVRVVYQAWARISEERTTTRRASGGGGPTPFGF